MKIKHDSKKLKKFITEINECKFPYNLRVSFEIKFGNTFGYCYNLYLFKDNIIIDRMYSDDLKEVRKKYYEIKVDILGE